MYLLKNNLELTLLTLGQVYETHSGHQQSLLEIGNILRFSIRKV